MSTSANISGLSKQLILDEHGIWTAERTSTLSYPENANANCFDLEDKSYWFRHRNRCIISAVMRFRPSGPILDVGGGNGFVTKDMIDNGIPAILLEPGRDGALNGRTQRNIPDVICSTLEEADFSENSVPAIGLFDVLEHVEDDGAFVKTLHAILNPAGMLYITVPGYQSLWSLRDITAGHYRRYNRNSLCSVIGERFEVLYFTYFFSALTLPLFFFRTLPFRLGLAKDRNVMSREVEHGTSGGFTAELMTRLLGREIKKIQRGKGMLMGTSCLVVARKLVV